MLDELTEAPCPALPKPVQVAEKSHGNLKTDRSSINLPIINMAWGERAWQWESETNIFKSKQTIPLIFYFPCSLYM